jgi:hypothetical protein
MAAMNLPSGEDGGKRPDLEKLAAAIIRAGHGRGFIVDFRWRRSVQGWPHPVFDRRRLVITAAHCVPGRFPRALSFAADWERTYPRLVGPLGRSRPKVPAELLFIDPIADIAVFGSPDAQELHEAAEVYSTLVDHRTALRAGAISGAAPAWRMRLDGYWAAYRVTENGGALWHQEPELPTQGGMSGSPIINAAGLAIGVHTCARGPDPYLLRHLPVWLANGVRGRSGRRL